MFGKLFNIIEPCLGIMWLVVGIIKFCFIWGAVELFIDIPVIDWLIALAVCFIPVISSIICVFSAYFIAHWAIWAIVLIMLPEILLLLGSIVNFVASKKNN